MNSTSQWGKFELRRQSNPLVYTFVSPARLDGSDGYKRLDGDYWIIRKPAWGWIAWDDESQSLAGRPWSVLPEEQGDHPPEGTWVSRKGEKSYVYELVYVA